MKERISDFSEDWLHKFGRYWTHVLALVADLAALVGVAVAFLADYGRGLVPIYILGLLTVLWILLIVQEFRYARKASYSEAMRYVHMVVHYLRDTAGEVPNISDDALKHNLERILGSLTTAFALVTRTSCRASIKVLALSPQAPNDWQSQDEPARYLLVRTLARDLASATGVQERADWVTENTDFHELFLHPKQRCFFENDLKKLISRGKYRNSHLPSTFDNRRDDWPLPYRSTIVWPIRLLKDEDKPEVWGFLCVDSRSRRVFVHRYDFELGATVADALYMYIAQYKMRLN